VSQSKTIRNIAQKSGVGTPADVADMAKKLDISIEDYWKLKDAAFEEHADIIATLNKNLKGDDLVEAQHIVTDIAVIYKKKYGKTPTQIKSELNGLVRSCRL
jgi:predicted nucleic acid-binding protein